MINFKIYLYYNKNLLTHKELLIKIFLFLFTIILFSYVFINLTLLFAYIRVFKTLLSDVEIELNELQNDIDLLKSAIDDKKFLTINYKSAIIINCLCVCLCGCLLALKHI